MKILYRLPILFILVSLIYIKEISAQNDSTATISISAVGDLMCHETQYLYAQVDSNSYDFHGVFEPVKSLLSSSDLTIGNVETTFAGRERTLSGYPRFNTPDEYLDALRDSGFDVLVTSNNHAFDKGKEGVLRTISEIRKRGMTPLGTFENREQRDSVRVIDVRGVKIAMLAYTFATNFGRPEPEDAHLVNYIKRNLIASDIKKARNSSADLVLVYFHFGREYLREPTERQISVVNKAVDAGADIVLGCHTHVVQKVDFFTPKYSSLDSGIIAYSLGNFVSNQRWQYSDGGVILKINLRKNFTTGKISLVNAEFQPVWVYKNEEKWFYKIYPAADSIASRYSFFAADDSAAFLQSYFDTKEILNSSSKNLILSKSSNPGID